MRPYYLINIGIESERTMHDVQILLCARLNGNDRFILSRTTQRTIGNIDRFCFVQSLAQIWLQSFLWKMSRDTGSYTRQRTRTLLLRSLANVWLTNGIYACEQHVDSLRFCSKSRFSLSVFFRSRCSAQVSKFICKQFLGSAFWCWLLVVGLFFFINNCVKTVYKNNSKGSEGLCKRARERGFRSCCCAKMSLCQLIVWSFSVFHFNYIAAQNESQRSMIRSLTQPSTPNINDIDDDNR